MPWRRVFSDWKNWEIYLNPNGDPGREDIRPDYEIGYLHQLEALLAQILQVSPDEALEKAIAESRISAQKV